MTNRELGTVKWFDCAKGYGFINSVNSEVQAESERSEVQADHECESIGEGAPDIFVHFRQINGEGFRSLNQGDTVEFTRTQTTKGFQASDVILVVN